ncbi:MAG: C40 family peptidase [Candidatus Berkelbacteria bacterium]|nr:C40 family peptidase [Candidatus Berkelbacteria bacterium]
MIYRAVNNRCLVDFDQLNLPISKAEALTILEEQGFQVLVCSVVEVAQSLVGNATYRRGARLQEAPAVLDCSSLVKWVYGQIGVWLPRRAIQQREYGFSIGLSDLQPGDLVFISGWIDRYVDDPSDGVGHVGIFVGNNKVVHAANNKVGVVYSPLDRFARNHDFRGARRIAQLEHSTVLLLPEGREVETSDDVKWIVLQSLPRDS